MFQRLFCLFGRHKRSVWFRFQDSDGSYRSRCRGCEVAMQRGSDKIWVVEPGASPRRALFRRRARKPKLAK